MERYKHKIEKVCLKVKQKHRKIKKNGKIRKIREPVPKVHHQINKDPPPSKKEKTVMMEGRK